MSQHKRVYLKDYTPPAFNIIHVDLTFDIFDDKTVVTNVMQMKSNSDEEKLVLNGESLELNKLHVNGRQYSDYELDDKHLTLLHVEDNFTLEIETVIYPHKNSSLQGLYLSDKILCTQNEPEGFRNITYFMDRPDVMSKFRTTIIADSETYPILLSNGNKVATETLENGRHRVVWDDDSLKPCYLFALVAGELDVLEDEFITCSGKSVALAIYCDVGNVERTHFAMKSLKDAMKWDEDVYGLEYDLDIYNIVAVDSFNMGAMENKSLNIFNSHYVLASSSSATDENYLGIQSVIAHEYFHNYTGNRITCRDWFQLTLKEGLTVFRDQCFSADMNSQTISRIDDVKALRQRQFLEDAGPTSHPIKPDSYIEMNNFYTSTVYEKGAEVIRMLYTLLGKDKFFKAMDYYFEKFDESAITTENFLEAMEFGNGEKLEQFRLWYSQMRTPILHVESSFKNSELTLTLTQEILNDVDGNRQLPLYYPLNVAIFDENGNKQALHVKRDMLIISKQSEQFTFKNIAKNSTISINRNFSAPIIVKYKEANNLFLMKYDDDGFNRYEAHSVIASQIIDDIMNKKEISKEYLSAYESILDDTTCDVMLKSRLLEIPPVTILLQKYDEVDIHAIDGAREILRKKLSSTFKEKLLKIYNEFNDLNDDSIDAKAFSSRSLKNSVLNLLFTCKDEKIINLAYNQYYNCSTMSDKLSALKLLTQSSYKQEVLKDFFSQHKEDALVLTKYFSVVASNEDENVLDDILEELNSPYFNMKVPNLVRSLIGSFAQNLTKFHTKEGYEFVAQKVIELDEINPQIASSLVQSFKLYKKLPLDLQSKMDKELQKVINHKSLSNNVFEIVEKICN
ncbi:MAG: aminopeptidase N [Campylobacterota bacterium]|nr:aminopeptidase N [Campylobacterota bacterium]